MASNEYYTTGMHQMSISQPEAHPGKKYARAYKILGITQLVLGVVSVAVGSANLYVWARNPYNGFCWGYIGSAIWTGLWMVTAGFLGVLAGNKQNNCTITGGLVITIFTAIFACFMASMEAMGVIRSSPTHQRNHISFHASLLVIAVVELIVAIVHSAYCCAGTSCKPRMVAPLPIAQNPYSFGGPTVYSSGQPLGMAPGAQYQQFPNQWQMNPAHTAQERKNLPNCTTP